MNSAALPDRGREEQHAHVRRKHGQRQFPNDAALRVGKAVELVHHDSRHAGEVERRRMQQTIEQDLGDDHQDPSLRR